MTSKEASKAMFRGQIVAYKDLLFRRTPDGNVITTTKTNPLETKSIDDYLGWIQVYKGTDLEEAS